MKINKAKLLVGTLAVVATAATVGSISGTVAWFQYNTRATVNYNGASAHCTENLQIRIYNKDLVGASKKYADSNAFHTDNPSWAQWSSELKMADVNAYILAARGSYANSSWTDSTDSGLYPISSQELAENAVATEFYRNPIRGYTDKAKWQKATANDYVDLPLQFRVADVNGARNTAGDFTKFLEKKVYLSDLTIASKTVSGKLDITPALRVAFPGATNVAQTSGATPANTTTNVGTFWNGSAKDEVDVYGELDLNGDGINDRLFTDTSVTPNVVRIPYEFDDPSKIAAAVYGDSNKKAVASGLVKSTTSAPTLLADDSDPYKILGNELFTAKGFDASSAVPADDAWTTLNVRIYLEGWKKLSTTVAYTQTTAADAAGLLTLLQANTSVTPNKPAAPAGYYKLSGNSGTVHYWNGTAVGSALTGGKDTVAVWNDTEFVGASFNIGMRFSAEAHLAQGE